MNASTGGRSFQTNTYLGHHLKQALYKSLGQALAFDMSILLYSSKTHHSEALSMSEPAAC
ncbi:MAG: hypothetical protein CCU26_15825 [Nitrospira sp. UW-LDO-01]|nr:MAG: hypothetical protein CCU26_15825 [Nitrospira sp. UW-LDO-01]